MKKLFKNFRLKREKGSHLLEVLGMIIVAVIILLLFKDALLNLFNLTMEETNAQVMNMFSH